MGEMRRDAPRTSATPVTATAFRVKASRQARPRPRPLQNRHEQGPGLRKASLIASRCQANSGRGHGVHGPMASLVFRRPHPRRACNSTTREGGGQLVGRVRITEAGRRALDD
jgi:hypothetical protein